MFTRQQILLIAVIALFLYNTYPTQAKSIVADVADAGEAVVDKVAQAGAAASTAASTAVSAAVSTVVNVPQTQTLAPQPKTVQEAPPGYEQFTQPRFGKRERFSDPCASGGPAEGSSICDTYTQQRFGQEGSTPAPATDTADDAAPAAAVAGPECPSLGALIAKNRFNPMLAKVAKSDYEGDKDPYSYLGSNLMNVTPDWETNFANDIQSDQVVNAVLTDPSRMFESTPPQATTMGGDIRALEPLGFSAEAQLKLLPTLTRLQTSQGI
jgi:hypothetical protein